jgi:hypothetical protein
MHAALACQRYDLSLVIARASFFSGATIRVENDNSNDWCSRIAN